MFYTASTSQRPTVVAVNLVQQTVPLEKCFVREFVFGARDCWSTPFPFTHRMISADTGSKT